MSDHRDKLAQCKAELNKMRNCSPFVDPEEPYVWLVDFARAVRGQVERLLLTPENYEVATRPENKHVKDCAEDRGKHEAALTLLSLLVQLITREPYTGIDGKCPACGKPWPAGQTRCECGAKYVSAADGQPHQPTGATT